MPSSDYTSAVPGGLRLKGAAKDSGIKKKKKVKKPESDVDAQNGKKDNLLISGDKEQPAAADQHDASGEDAGRFKSINDLPADAEGAPQDDQIGKQDGKTEAQRRHEERRRKRLDERLQREGSKTHKQRVEELNKYLSGLSEHHDMPRIGPG